MAHTSSEDTKTISHTDELEKKQKKLTKKEAKLTLLIEQAKKDVQKAEQKLTRAQEKLQARSSYLHELETTLSQLQTQAKKKESSKTANNEPKREEASFTHQVEVQLQSSTPTTTEEQKVAEDREEHDAERETVKDEALLLSQPPAEGRNDIQAADNKQLTFPADHYTPQEEANNDQQEDAERDRGDEEQEKVAQLPPTEGRVDLTPEKAIEQPIQPADPTPQPTDAESTTPIEDIPGIPTQTETGAIVHAEISIQPSQDENEEEEKNQAKPKPVRRSSTRRKTKPTPATEEVTITSGEGSIPIVTNDENAWPPPPVREELAEAIVEEIKQEKAETTNGTHRAHKRTNTRRRTSTRTDIPPEK